MASGPFFNRVLCFCCVFCVFCGKQVSRLDDMGRRTLNLRLLQSEGKEKAESLHVHNDHIDKLLHDIVSKHHNHT